MVGWCSMGTFSDPCFWTEEMSLGLGYPTPPGSCDHHAERAVAASAGRLDTGTPWKQMAPGFFCWNMPCLVFFFPIFLIRSVASMLEQLLPCHCRKCNSCGSTQDLSSKRMAEPRQLRVGKSKSYKMLWQRQNLLFWGWAWNEKKPETGSL